MKKRLSAGMLIRIISSDGAVAQDLTCVCPPSCCLFKGLVNLVCGIYIPTDLLTTVISMARFPSQYDPEIDRIVVQKWNKDKKWRGKRIERNKTTKQLNGICLKFLTVSKYPWGNQLVKSLILHRVWGKFFLMPHFHTYIHTCWQSRWVWGNLVPFVRDLDVKRWIRMKMFPPLISWD